MSKVKIQGLKAYITNAFDFCVGNRIEYKKEENEK